jgi:membrane-bound lytic murein transglycosylase D
VRVSFHTKKSRPQPFARINPPHWIASSAPYSTIRFVGARFAIRTFSFAIAAAFAGTALAQSAAAPAAAVEPTTPVAPIVSASPIAPIAPAAPEPKLVAPANVSVPQVSSGTVVAPTSPAVVPQAAPITATTLVPQVAPATTTPPAPSIEVNPLEATKTIETKPQIAPSMTNAIVAPAATSTSTQEPSSAPSIVPSTTSYVPLATESASPATAAQYAPIAPVAPSDLWDRIRVGYAMPDLEDDLVGKWEKYYADRPDYVARIVDRSSKYMFYIVTEIERRGMPLEIALLPMIESAFNPIAHSSAKASGIWQFIPSTGTQFGMKQDWWADSRRDIVAATNGALDYLQKLHGMFGDWQLALASYNWGEGSVQRAVARSKNAGRDGTYLSLTMPAETRNYLPKLQAVKNIIRDPARFGLTIASVPNEPYFKTITLAHAIDVKKAAQFAGMSEADFVALNPAHNRPVIAGRGEFQILLPADRADQFISRLESYDKPRVSWMAYKTRAGDRIEALAQRFGTSVDALRSVNGIRGRVSALPAGYHLLVPSDGPSADALGSIQNAVFTKFPEYTQVASGRAHKVRKGETLGVIAKRYGVSTASLMKWNRLGKASVRAGQTIYVSGPAPTRAQIRGTPKTVRVAAGKSGKSAKAAKKSGKAVKASKRGKANRR